MPEKKPPDFTKDEIRLNPGSIDITSALNAHEKYQAREKERLEKG
jgi:hypothetical protein